MSTQLKHTKENFSSSLICFWLKLHFSSSNQQKELLVMMYFWTMMHYRMSPPSELILEPQNWCYFLFKIWLWQLRKIKISTSNPLKNVIKTSVTSTAPDKESRGTCAILTRRILYFTEKLSCQNFLCIIKCKMTWSWTILNPVRTTFYVGLWT